MKMTTTVLAVFVSVVILGALAVAQERPAQDPKPVVPNAAAAGTQPPTPVQVLEQLRGAAPAVTASAEDVPSTKTILDRYNKMIATGSRTTQPPPNKTSVLSAKLPTTATTTSAVQTTAGDSAVTVPRGQHAELPAILEEMRRLIVRLESIIGDGGVR